MKIETKEATRRDAAASPSLYFLFISSFFIIIIFKSAIANRLLTRSKIGKCWRPLFVCVYSQDSVLFNRLFCMAMDTAKHDTVLDVFHFLYIGTRRLIADESNNPCKAQVL